MAEGLGLPRERSPDIVEGRCEKSTSDNQASEKTFIWARKRDYPEGGMSSSRRTLQFEVLRGRFGSRILDLKEIGGVEGFVERQLIRRCGGGPDGPG